MLGFLRATVDENRSVHPDDMKPLKRSLGLLGYYRPTEGASLHEFPDEPLFTGIRTFQSNEGLTADGVMKPGGPTEARLLKPVSEMGAPPGADKIIVVTEDEADRRLEVRDKSPGPFGDVEEKPRQQRQRPDVPWKERWEQIKEWWEGPTPSRMPPTHGVGTWRSNG